MLLHENELRFLCDTLKKCRVPFCFINRNESYDKLIDDDFRAIFDSIVDRSEIFSSILSSIEHYKMYRLNNSLKFNFLFCLLPDTVDQTVFMIGPYLSSAISSRQVLEIGEKFAVSPKKLKLLEDYYAAIPIVDDTSHIFAMIETFGEHIWGGSTAFSVVDVNAVLQPDETQINKNIGNEENDDIFVKMRIMEKRYDYENEFIRAITQGQIHKVDRILSNMGAMSFEKRLADPLRNLKNYGIIMNTLSRKAAENGGVHPIHLDSLSSTFAAKIEQMSTPAEMQLLMQDMFRSYCRLVRKHSMRNYSSTVQKAIVYIESDLSANLTLSVLADAQNVSAGYLSTIFKKETGMTVTEYINSKRVKHAMHLLATTKLQIQTIALHCGIMDVQYFSKVFKKYTGKTPREYRSETGKK